jgi:hypothetical protein
VPIGQPNKRSDIVKEILEQGVFNGKGSHLSGNAQGVRIQEAEKIASEGRFAIFCLGDCHCTSGRGDIKVGCVGLEGCSREGAAGAVGG